MTRLFFDSNSTKNKKILSRIFLSYGILILILLLIGIYFYNSAVKNTELQITQQNTFDLKQQISELDSSFNIFSSFASQLSTNSTTHRMMMESKRSASFYIEAYDTMSYLTQLMCLQSVLPIENCFVYLPKTDYIILPSSSMESYSYYEYIKKYKTSSYSAFIDMISEPSNANRFLPLDDFMDKDSDEDSYLYFCNLYLGTSLSAPAAFFCFTIDESKIVSNFTESTKLDDQYIYIYNPNQDQSYVFPYNEELPFNPVEEHSKKSSFFDLFSKDDYVITTSTSAKNGWEYYYIKPTSEVLTGFQTYKSVYQIVLLLAAFLSISGFFALTRQGMKPYIEMQTKLENSESEMISLQGEIANQLPYVKNAYLYRLMNGYFDQKTNPEKVLNFLKLDFNENMYSILYVIIGKSYENVIVSLNLSHSPHEQSDESTSVSVERMETLFSQIWGESVCVYKPVSNHFALVLPLQAGRDAYCSFLEDTKKKCEALNTTLQSEHQIVAGFGLGKANARPNYLWESYHLAKEAISFVTSSHTFQCYKNIIRGNDVYYFPKQLIDKMNLFITTGNTRQTAEIFKMIMSENFEYRNLPYHVQEWLISDIRNTLVKLRYDMHPSDTSDASFERLDEMMLSIKSVLDEEKIAIFMATMHESHPEKNKLISDIEQYLISNFADAELSLSKISEEFGISESYFSSLFKSEIKQNFSDYLEHLRMTHAMALLKDPEVNISDIYLLVGYHNANSFRRAFKKNYGSSPSEIRVSLK